MTHHMDCMQAWAAADHTRPQHELLLSSDQYSGPATGFSMSPVGLSAAVGFARVASWVAFSSAGDRDSQPSSACELAAIATHVGPVTCVAWHPISSAVASACDEGTLCITIL